MSHEIDLRKAFGGRLKAARQAVDLTLEAVGKCMTSSGWRASKQTVSHWETGRNLPDPLVLRKLCRLYEVSADALLWDGEEAERPGTAGLGPDLLRRLDLATPQQQTIIRNTVGSLLDSLNVPAPTSTAARTKPSKAA